MVWINDQCINSSPKGRNGEMIFGGAMCSCRKCRDKRYEETKAEELKNQCPHCKGTE